MYKALSRHPDIWMPPVKELNYFNKLGDGTRTIAMTSPRVLMVRARDYLRGERRNSTQDSLGHTLAWDWHYFFGPRSIQWYTGIFRPREGQLTGEITPAYAIIPEEQIQRINSHNPDLRAVYILRNPVDRAWSSIVNHLARKQRRSIDQVPPEAIARKVAGIAEAARAQYPANIRRWRSVIGQERLFIGYMEEIKQDPAELLQRICSFLGAPPAPPETLEHILAPVNTTRKHGGAMPQEIRYELSKNLLPVMEETAALLDSPYPAQWLETARSVLAQEGTEA